jgi:hypothetical protein
MVFSCGSVGDSNPLSLISLRIGLDSMLKAFFGVSAKAHLSFLDQEDRMEACVKALWKIVRHYLCSLVYEEDVFRDGTKQHIDGWSTITAMNIEGCLVSLT